MKNHQLQPSHFGKTAKAAVTPWETDELSKLVEEALDNMSPRSYPKAQSGIRGVAYSVIEHVIFDLLPKDVNCEALDAHLAKYFDT